MSRTPILTPSSSRSRRFIASLLVLVSLPAVAGAQQSCPRASGADAQAGWAAYRSGDMTTARSRFQAALARCPDDQYARTGLAYVELRASHDADARTLFETVVAVQPNDVDALVGLGLLAWRAGDLQGVSDRFRRVLQLAPDNATAKETLAKLPPGLGPPPKRPPLVLPDTLVYPARTRGDRFEVRTPNGWEPFYLKGVNLGAALPGKYPSQFPDSATYARWIAQMAAMDANVVRVYTIHPPAFYEALRAWDLAHPDRPLWLVHGVWTETPEKVDSSSDYLAPDFEAQFFAEMKRVVDLVHGRADILPRPGHASGFYTADVSRWTLAYIIGREWEPYSAMAFDSLHAGFTAWQGSYVRLSGGNPMEAWLAKAVDHMVAYETETYHAQRPVAYTNWPTLDPLHHPTESTRAQEVAMREKLGERVDFKPREYNNDILSLDASKMHATAADPAGVFASYHAYPYYPDFMVLQPSYRTARSSYGPSSYFGYLKALKAHDAGMPVVIAEYGVPASLGPAHLQPQGMHHGGHSEEDMAHVDRRLTAEIAESGMAGGILFSWIDEWFKRNWLTTDFEDPAARNRLWYNRLDAEQQYGMMAVEAQPPLAGATLHQRRAAWSKVPPLYRDSAGTVRATWDDAYLWLYVETPAWRPGDTVYVGLDLRAPAAGEFRWPGAVGPRLPVGVEFVVEDDGDGVRVLADPAMDPFRLVPVGQGTRARPGGTPTIADPPAGFFTGRLEQRYNLPYRIVPRDDGAYDSLRVISNRRRIGRDSTEYLAMGYDRGVLPRGEAPDGYWERDGDAVEMRIPWMLIDVTDPSSRSVLAGAGAAASKGGRTAEGLVRLSGGQEVAPDTLVGELATDSVKSIGIVAALAGAGGSWTSWPGAGEATARFTWPTWNADGVRWRVRERPVYDTMAATFAALDPYGTGAPSRAAGAPPPAAVPHPPAAPQQVDSADAAWRKGNQDLALFLYLRRLQKDSTDEVALHRVALMRAWAGHYQLALGLLDRVIREDPANLDAQVDHARVRAWSGDTSGALDELAKLLKAHPNHAGALQARATFEAWAGRYNEALSTYDKVLAISPDNASARRQEAQVLSWASRFAESRALYDSLLAENPADVDARLGLAQVLTYANDLKGALREYHRVLADHPGNAKALQGVGRALSWEGKL
ncbi:MAG: tetratricopeptide repeat protein, partial [Gemmatimonadetes bacterium]|nr:tetratricopeptide repeat protein [Gemmatimonadota bacterium]